MENPPGSSKIFPSNLQCGGDAMGNLAARHWNNSQMSHPWWSWRMTWQKHGSLETMPMNSSGPMLWYVHRHGYIYIFILCVHVYVYIYINPMSPIFQMPSRPTASCATEVIVLTEDLVKYQASPASALECIQDNEGYIWEFLMFAGKIVMTFPYAASNHR